MDAAERLELDLLLSRAEDNARSDWEMSFVEDMQDKAEDLNWSPTDRQWEKLEEIAER